MPADLKVGLLGVGAIGQILATALDAEPSRAVLVAIADQDRARAERFAAQLKARPPVVEIDELVRRSDFIIEAASQAALPEIVPRALRRLFVLFPGKSERPTTFRSGPDCDAIGEPAGIQDTFLICQKQA